MTDAVLESAGEKEMTDEELIATKVLGWEREPAYVGRVYTKDGGMMAFEGDEMVAGRRAPDFHTLGGCREFERALNTRHRTLWLRYLEQLGRGAGFGYERETSICLAGPSQRVKAAATVIREAGL
jgi:hypothetical protein